MDTVSIKLQMQADAAYRRGDIVEAIQLTKTAMKAATSDSAKKALLVVLLRKAMAEPIPVARPANSVTANAKTIALSTVYLSLEDEKTG